MINYKKAKELVLKEHNDSFIVSGMSLKNAYLFSIKPKNWDKGTLLDPFFKVSSDGTVSEYSPVMDPDEFKYGLAHVIEVNQNV